MLSIKDNELLTHVGSGTPMGELMRQYWMPFLLSTELESDGDVLRIRLLGEDLLAFRDSNGVIGVLGANCPHRGADLFYARNEEAGLRCVYHGWKFDTSGACVDMPSEPPDSNFHTRVRVKSYVCRERNGAAWIYMGSRAVPPSLPDLEWNLIPESQRYLAKRVQFCNWAQAIEGEIDQSHVSFLHQAGDQLKLTEDDLTRDDVAAWRKRDKHPRFHVRDTEYGVMIGAERSADEDSNYWRITQYLMPFHTMTGPYGENPSRQTRAWIPIDDHTTLVFAAQFHPLRDLTEAETERLRLGTGAGFVGEPHFAPKTNRPFGAWIPKASKENDFFFDRSLQQTKHFSGIPEFWAQDGGMQEGMGLIYDRTQEHLGTSDAAVIRVRARALGAAKALFADDVAPPSALDPTLYRVRGAAALLPKGANWVEETEPLRGVIPGVNQAAPGR